MKKHRHRRSNSTDMDSLKQSRIEERSNSDEETKSVKIWLKDLDLNEVSVYECLKTST